MLKSRGRIMVVLLACGFVLGAAGLLMADVPDNFVELDGNSVMNGTACTAPNTPSGCKDDWNLLNGGGGSNPTGSAGGSLARSFISGAASIAVFTGGGSKDPIDIPSWKWKNGGTPDKDAITNGYAAAYQAPDGHLILEFGADRFAVNGDANIGLWFFQQDVHPVGSTGGGFSGQHVNDDIFIVSAFTQGGGVSTITVYTWDDTCAKGVKNPGPGDCADQNLRLKFASIPSSTCTGVEEGCAIVNPTGITVSWPYLAKFGNNSTTIPEGGFYEGGLDVTELLGTTNLPCFTSFLIETRSSQTPSAVLKDFVSGSFNICGLSATKNCLGNGVLIEGGTSIGYTFTGTVTNTGIGALSNVTIVDSLPSGATNVAFFKGTPPADATTPVNTVTCPSGAPVGAVCANLGGLSAGQVVNWAVEFDSTSLNVQNNVFAAAASSGNPGACTDAGTICSAPTNNTCSTSPSNSITISKSCGVPTGYPNAVLPGTQLVTSGGGAMVQVNFSGDINNTGQTPLTGITLTDDPSATITVSWPDPSKPGEIPAGGTAKYSGHYLPSGVTAGDLGGASGRYNFTDSIKVTGATATLGTSPGHDATCLGAFNSDAQACGGATCNICPAGATCAGN